MYGDLAMGAGPSVVLEGCLKGSCDSSCTKAGHWCLELACRQSTR